MRKLQVYVDIAGPRQDIAVMRVEGFIDSDTSRNVSKILEEIITKGNNKIVFNLEKTEYISSAGWGIFMGEVRSVREKGGDLKLAGMIPEVEEVYKMLEFFTVLTAYESTEAAIQEFK